MQSTDYLIIGASHAALSALNTLRMHDTDGVVTMVTRDASLPYSPTVLPYVVSGRSSPERVFLRDDDFFRAQKVDYRRGAAVEKVDPARNTARLEDGEEIAYGKLLVASGAKPIVPPIPGLAAVPFHVLRTLDDAVALHRALPATEHSVVLGAGLIGMHAAENLAKAGAKVTIVEMQPHVLPGYFDAEAAALIERAFVAAGVRLHTGTQAMRVDPMARGCRISLSSGEAIDGDLLVVGVGVHGDGIAGAEVVKTVDAEQGRYLKIVLADNRLVGIFGIGVAFDPGVMWELILRRIDLAPVRERFLQSPQDAARVLMSRTWR